ncbi:transposase [Methylomarinum sp. Ch1-1]|uniref:Transposase n=1 Tax=Methylomarinum roseum TaxID=3067653 RepID=A0AAU7NX59_9GAMM|nr:transposase [Methylomarinum sp. Ch1-1]MDP4522271.1 transposase [Methylomarinum sp. Ch1-1]
MTKSSYRVLMNPCPHFLTATVNAWLPLFTQPQTVDIVLDSWRFLQNSGKFKLYGYVILENHLHLIAASDDLSRDMQRFKSYTAKQIIAHLEQQNAERLLGLLAFFKRAHKTESRYQIWEEGSHPKMIESESVMRQKLEYIHQNPVKRGYVDRPEHWRYSSARNYLGQPGLIDVVREW